MRRREILAGTAAAVASLAGCLAGGSDGTAGKPAGTDRDGSMPTQTDSGERAARESAATVAAADVGPDERTLSLTRDLFAERSCPSTDGARPSLCSLAARDSLPVALVAEPPVVSGGGHRSTAPATVTVRLYNAAGSAVSVETPWLLRRLADDGTWHDIAEGGHDGPDRVPAGAHHDWRFLQDAHGPVGTPTPRPTTVPGDGDQRGWELPPGEYAVALPVTVPENARLEPDAPVDPGGTVDLVARFLFRGGSVLLESQVTLHG